MAIKPIPSELKFSRIEWKVSQPAQVNRSTYTGARQVVTLAGGSMISASIDFTPFRDEKEVRAWRGWLISLEGQVHTFYVPGSIAPQHAGSNPTATVAAGASSATLSLSPALTTGMHVTFTLASGRRQMVTLTENISGAVIKFMPRLREAATGVVETINPYAQVALTADTVAWLSQAGGMFELPMIEVEEAY